MGFFETLECPRPGFETLGVLGRILEGIGPVGTASTRFDHGVAFRKEVIAHGMIATKSQGGE